MSRVRLIVPCWVLLAICGATYIGVRNYLRTKADAVPRFAKMLSDGYARRLFRGAAGMQSYFLKLIAADSSYVPARQSLALEAIEKIENRKAARRKKEIYDKYWKSFKR